MTNTQDFQDAGEEYRRNADIDGTAGDAQDINHAWVEDGRYPGVCILCGLSSTAQIHQRPEGTL